ncbi:MAG: SDR family oxidoreductase [Alphaproteobacteria bacterium]|nr:SDR family oxidoreductase [Alphaproteobacteria bacterium]
MRLENLVAFVTGGSGGLGLAIAQRFIAEGATIIAADIDRKRLDQMAGQINAGGNRLSTVLLDVSNYDDVKAVIDKAIADFGHLDILVNNAGISPKAKGWLECDIEEWHQVLNINLSGEFYCARSVAEHMIERGSGRIINISSSAWRHGGVARGGGVPYASSKAGVIGLTRSLAKQLGAHGITVNAIAPGPTHSPMTVSWLPDTQDTLSESIPLGRVGQPIDIANAALFLASDEAAFITGQCLDVNGGLTFS